ncbi:MAG: 2-C-methyl-D-erythritol 4-phosphate cytidylyltransferase, partial [Gammaproteobacteria bacterium]
MYAVVPAAGIGRRMESDIPKQYLKLKNKTVIEHTLERLLKVKSIEKIVVVIADHDEVWPDLSLSEHPKVITAPGGQERCHSVLNGLQVIDRVVTENIDDSWVLVHDAARPCVRPNDILRLISELDGHAVGGILGAPVRDTLKKANADNSINDTIDRNGLWHAFTPQMFKFKMLVKALQDALEQSVIVTDEAQAIERSGHVPLLVEGETD